MNKVYRVMCKRCGNKQKTAPSVRLKEAKKKCVFCNFTWKIYKNVNDHSILNFQDI